MSQIYQTREGDILDWICWKQYGDQSGGVEAVLEENSWLADYGYILPEGLLITLPDLDLPETEELIRLWD